MSFVVADACAALGLRAGAIVFRGLHIESASSTLRAEISQEIESLRSRFPDPKTVRSLPEVMAYQEILRKVGVNPKRDRPSVDRLVTFALERGSLPAINTLVDAYNLISVRSLCSLGAHDIDRIALPVTLRMLTGSEWFIPLGGDKEVPVSEKEFGYVDAAERVLCRLDVLQADFSKVTPATTNALLIIEGTAAHAPEMLRKAFEDAIALITRHCGGAGEIAAFPGQPLDNTPPRE